MTKMVRLTPRSTGGETGQQNSGHQTRSNHSIARSISTAKADTTGTHHSIPSPAQDNLKGEPETDAHEGNKSQPKSDGQKNSYDSIAHSNRSGIAKSDRAHHITHGSIPCNTCSAFSPALISLWTARPGTEKP